MATKVSRYEPDSIRGALLICSSVPTEYALRCTPLRSAVELVGTDQSGFD